MPTSDPPASTAERASSRRMCALFWPIAARATGTKTEETITTIEKVCDCDSIAPAQELRAQAPVDLPVHVGLAEDPHCSAFRGGCDVISPSSSSSSSSFLYSFNTERVTRAMYQEEGAQRMDRYFWR